MRRRGGPRRELARLEDAIDHVAGRRRGRRGSLAARQQGRRQQDERDGSVTNCTCVHRVGIISRWRRVSPGPPPIKRWHGAPTSGRVPAACLGRAWLPPSGGRLRELRSQLRISPTAAFRLKGWKPEAAPLEEPLTHRQTRRSYGAVCIRRHGPGRPGRQRARQQCRGLLFRLSGPAEERRSEEGGRQSLSEGHRPARRRRSSDGNSPKRSASAATSGSGRR